MYRTILLETFVGYYDSLANENAISQESFFVHCAGRYRLVTIEHFSTERPKGSKNHQLLYVAEGKARFILNEKEYILTPGHAILYLPGEPEYYYYDLVDQPLIYWIHFSTRHEENFLIHTGWVKNRIRYGGQTLQLIQLFDTMIQLLQRQDLYFELELKSILQQLLIIMSRSHTRSKQLQSPYSKEIDEAIQYIHQNPESSFTLKEYTRSKGINYYRFIDHFTKQTGVSPRQYIIHVRMNIAKDMLTNASLNITEVAQLIGYDNPLYFSRLFKKHWGISPSAFRHNP